MTDKDRLDAIAQAEADEYRRRQSLEFLNCAINLCATDFEPEEVAFLLIRHANDILEYG